MGAIWSSLIDLVGQILEYLYGITHNYGLAIILLTLIIRGIMYPLMQKQMTSMRETQKIQPLMQEIQKKYKNDKEKMNQELMRLYKEHKVNPMGGCLPLIVQMPILILFFQVLREFEYHIPGTKIIDGGFLWISNTVTEKIVENGAEIERVIAGLAAPDQLFGIISGYSIGILPILVGASMYIQQKLTTSATASTASSSANPTANTQKMMTTIMPIMIGFISFTLPSGLSLYWLTSTVFGIGQQMLINKKEPVPQEVDKLKDKEDVKNNKIDQKSNNIKEKKKEKDVKTNSVEEEVSWIPGYEKTGPKKTNKNNKKIRKDKKY